MTGVSKDMFIKDVIVSIVIAFMVISLAAILSGCQVDASSIVDKIKSPMYAEITDEMSSRLKNKLIRIYKKL